MYSSSRILILGAQDAKRKTTKKTGSILAMVINEDLQKSKLVFLLLVKTVSSIMTYLLTVIVLNLAKVIFFFWLLAPFSNF